MAATRRLPGRASGRPRALGELRHGERAAWITLLRLVVVDVALHAAGPRPSALPMTLPAHGDRGQQHVRGVRAHGHRVRSEEHTSELQSPCNLVCRLLLEKKKNTTSKTRAT